MTIQIRLEKFIIKFLQYYHFFQYIIINKYLVLNKNN